MPHLCSVRTRVTRRFARQGRLLLAPAVALSVHCGARDRRPTRRHEPSAGSTVVGLTPAEAPAALRTPAHAPTRTPVLTAASDPQAWVALVRFNDGTAVAIDTTTEVHDPTGVGMAILRFQRTQDRALNDTTTSRTSVERWMLDCGAHRYKWIGADYYAADGSVVLSLANDQRVGALPWDRAVPNSEGGLTLQAACLALRVRPAATAITPHAGTP